MLQCLIHADKQETYMQLEGHKGWWPRDETKREAPDPEHNPTSYVSRRTLRSRGDINENAILAARACNIDKFQELMCMSPEDHICLMGLVPDGIQALPKSNEEYVARTRGELEQLVHFIRGLHRNALKQGTELMEA
ncbi:hypothetical protein MBLNU13_g00512t1 [Cladosporium sp. NU13]